MTMFKPPRRYVVVLSNGTRIDCVELERAPGEPGADTSAGEIVDP